MRTPLAVAFGVSAAIAAGAAAIPQGPPEPQGTVRLPSVQFPPAQQGPQPTLPGQGERRSMPPFVGL